VSSISREWVSQIETAVMLLAIIVFAISAVGATLGLWS